MSLSIPSLSPPQSSSHLARALLLIAGCLLPGAAQGQLSPYDDELSQQLKGISTSTLFLHCENDNDVPITQAEEMYVGLRNLGVSATLARYPNEGHGFRQPQHIREAQRRADVWFDRYLRASAPTP